MPELSIPETATAACVAVVSVACMAVLQKMTKISAGNENTVGDRRLKENLMMPVYGFMFAGVTGILQTAFNV